MELYEFFCQKGDKGIAPCNIILLKWCKEGKIVNKSIKRGNNYDV